MSKAFVVLLSTDNYSHVYGPFPDEVRAEAFKAFISAEVDPAVVLQLTAPADELTAWYEQYKRGWPS